MTHRRAEGARPGTGPQARAGMPIHCQTGAFLWSNAGCLSGEVRRATRAGKSRICHDKPYISDSCMSSGGGRMARRWYVPLLAFPAAIGTVVAVLVGVASA